jgi:homoserine dehydrogenase
MSVTSSAGMPLRVALLGLGTVGRAVAGLLVRDGWRGHVSLRGITPPDLVAVGVRDPGRDRGVELPESVERSDDLAVLVDRDDVDVVVELLGGMEPANELIARALAAGKSVVTANKFLLAERGPALEATARHARASLRYEAAVAGGVPILTPLARDLSANRIDRVRGIVNGTTNFILTAMADEGRSYDEVLADAQAKGYAEADPSADVEGRDAVHKLVLLTRIACGVWVQPSGIPRTGITGVTAADVSAAAAEGLVIKLVASVQRVVTEAGLKLVAFVEPCAVTAASAIGSTRGVTNVVEVSGVPVGRVIFQGPGAGGDATSSAVLADLLALARGEGSTWALLPEGRPIGEVDDGRADAPRWQTYRLLED